MRSHDAKTTRTQRRRAQALVEFGLVVMLFVLLVSGVFDFGMLINTRLSVSSMSRVLARAAAAGASPSDLGTLAGQQDHITGVTTAPFSGHYLWTDGSPSALVMTETFYDKNWNVVGGLQPDGAVKIQVTAQGSEIITPLIRPFFGCTDGAQPCLVPISAMTTMPVEP
ncbi:MAG: pilus assembly protein [Chloroflexi bacterium]|nr:pilus assembly protein [Chloroflexota bacterium]